MKLAISKLGRKIYQRSKRIMEDKKNIRKYLITMKQKVKLPYLLGGVAVVSGLVASLLGVRYWRHRNDPSVVKSSKKDIIIAKEPHHRLANLMNGLALISSAVSLIGITKRMLK